MIPLCLDQGVGCIHWSPLARALLAGIGFGAGLGRAAVGLCRRRSAGVAGHDVGRAGAGAGCGPVAGRVDRLDGDGVRSGVGEVLDAPHAGFAAEVGYRADAAAVGEHVVGELGLRRLVVG
jgi:hypothetical protein